MLLLGRHQVLGHELAAALAEAVRFRNVLVHGYADVDDRRVVAHLSRLGDVAGFARRISLLLHDE